MTKKLIVNADDFGRSHGINLGTLECFKNGIVTSATVMINMPFAREAVSMAVANRIPLGLHLNITAGNVFFTGQSYLFGEGGKMKSLLRQEGVLSGKETEIIIAEYQAQIHRFVYLTRRHPTHLDHHHNVQKISGYLGRYFDFIKAAGLPTRTIYKTAGIKSPDVIVDNFFADNELNKSHLLKIINSLSTGTSELITHPSLITGEPLDSYTEVSRFRQVQLLTDPDIKQAIGQVNVQLISYQDL